MTPPVFIVDTNVVVAGLITRSSLSPVARALDGILSGSLVYLLPPALLDEYRAVLMRLSRLVLRIAVSLALAIAILWATAALWIDGPESRVLAGTLAGGLVLIGNGFLVDLAYERGTVTTSLGLDELKRRSDITARARSAADREEFSVAIREGLPPRPEPRRSAAYPWRPGLRLGT